MLVIIAAGGVHGAAGASVRQATPPASGFRLEVPYVPQSGALCGGAALAMVLRYWGEPGLHAGDFSALVDPARGGIATGALQGAALARGWDATVWYGSAQGARDVLAEGKPLIVLVQTRSGGFHYLVLVGWNRDGFVVHDPQVGPGRHLEPRCVRLRLGRRPAVGAAGAAFSRHATRETGGRRADLTTPGTRQRTVSLRGLGRSRARSRAGPGRRTGRYRCRAPAGRQPLPGR